MAAEEFYLTCKIRTVTVSVTDEDSWRVWLWFFSLCSK